MISPLLCVDGQFFAASKSNLEEESGAEKFVYCHQYQTLLETELTGKVEFHGKKPSWRRPSALNEKETRKHKRSRREQPEGSSFKVSTGSKRRDALMTYEWPKRLGINKAFKSWQ